MNGSYISSYSDRIHHTPSEQTGRWSGERGESLCAPKSEAAKEICAQHGVDGVQYSEGVPDFSPFAEETVNIGNMTGARENSEGIRYGRDGKDTVYVSFENGKPTSVSHHADKDSLADLNMKYDEPSNFQQADILIAQKWTSEQRDGKTWTAADISQYRHDNALTWHECNDMSTMQLVPTEINADFNHLGGVGEVNRADSLVAQSHLGEGGETASCDEDFDHMSAEELSALDRDFSTGHYDEDGNWVSNDEVQSENENTYNVGESSPASDEVVETCDYGIETGSSEDNSAELDSDFGAQDAEEISENEATSDYGVDAGSFEENSAEHDSDFGVVTAEEIGENETASDYGVEAGASAANGAANASDYSAGSGGASTDSSQGEGGSSQTIGD